MWQKIKNIYHLFQAILANILFRFPARSLKVIGVTGTDGKTTTATIIASILKEAGFKTSYLTSIEAEIAGEKEDTGFHVTTPSSFSLQKFLRKAVRMGSEYFVLETTSHAIDQNRIWGIPIHAGVLTNVSNEHLDYHKTYENYLRTKEKLLKKSKFAVVNRDDKSFKLLNLAGKKVITYGFTKTSDVNPKNFPFETKLLGDFNIYNALAAIAVCQELGIGKTSIKSALLKFSKPKGRMEEVYDKSFKVIIDFAHTPAAFDAILSALRPEVSGKIIHVFGSAGERDKAKRPLMGKASSKFADIIILTSEDPRSEDPLIIAEEIERGVKSEKAKVVKIIDRGQAIKEAIRIAQKGDLVLITGKGHEVSMNMGKGEEPWDEFEMVNQAIQTR